MNSQLAVMQEVEKRIPMDLYKLYMYDIEQNDEFTDIIFTDWPSTFNTDSIQISLEDIDDKKAISVEFDPSVPPLLEGVLQEQIESAELQKTESKIILHLKKVNKEPWNGLLIIKEHPKTKRFDPLSMFTLGLILISNPNQPKEQELGFNIIAHCADQAFPPAMNELAVILINTRDEQSTQHGLQILKALCDQYNFAPSDYQLGSLLLQSNPDEAVEYIKKAADSGFSPAILLYAFLLSPYSQTPIKTPKNPAEAVTYLNKFISEETEGNDKALALHELALLYYNGAEGVPQDQEKATSLQSEAKAITPEIPELMIGKEVTPIPMQAQRSNNAAIQSNSEDLSSGEIALIVGSTIGVLAAIGYGLYRYFKRHNNK